MEYSFIIAVIPIILVVAFIVWIAKKISAGERLDMKEGVVGVVILLVAVLVMVPMVSSTQVYMWNPDSGELTIQQNISGGAYAWDTYDDQIRSIVIKPGVTQIGNSAFDGATNLEYLSIPESVTDIGTNAFGVTLNDPFGSALEPAPGYYAGFGDGTLYHADASILAVSGINITGLASGATSAKYVVIPPSSVYTTIGSEAFKASGIEKIIALEGGVSAIGASAFENCASLADARFPKITAMARSTFSGCTALETVSFEAMPSALNGSMFLHCESLTSIVIPEGVASLASNFFNGCTALETVDLPASLRILGASAFTGCMSLASFEPKNGLQEISNLCFSGCTGLKTVDLPDSVTSLGSNVFQNCTAIEDVSVGSGLTSVQSTSFGSWRFYQQDGTTEIDKTVAANLAGKTFQGTASALVEISPGMLSLTPQQLQQVQLHSQEIQNQELDIQPLPFQPSVQTEDPVAA